MGDENATASKTRRVRALLKIETTIDVLVYMVSFLVRAQTEVKCHENTYTKTKSTLSRRIVWVVILVGGITQTKIVNAVAFRCWAVGDAWSAQCVSRAPTEGDMRRGSSVVLLVVYSGVFRFCAKYCGSQQLGIFVRWSSVLLIGVWSNSGHFIEHRFIERQLIK